MQFPSRPSECQFPQFTPLTAQHYGCRCERCVTAKRESTKRTSEKNRAKNSLRFRGYAAKEKVMVFQAYGGVVCRCCGENEIKFLSLDHVFNDGYAERDKSNRRKGGVPLYRRLRKLGYPDKHRYQVLCMNCNFGKKINKGTCPHDKTYPIDEFLSVNWGPGVPKPEYIQVVAR